MQGLACNKAMLLMDEAHSQLTLIQIIQIYKKRKRGNEYLVTFYATSPSPLLPLLPWLAIVGRQ
jgi:hypothetical protein